VKSPARPYDWATYVLLASLVVLIFLSFEHYRVAWDEERHDTYGDLILR
jgi:hypothetical protein